MDGAHTLERCEEVTNVVLESVFDHLFAARVVLEGIVLKPNMWYPARKVRRSRAPSRSRRQRCAP